MKSIAAVAAAALISGTAMYTVGSRTVPVEAFSTPASLQAQASPLVTGPAVGPFAGSAFTPARPDETFTAGHERGGVVERPSRPVARAAARREGQRSTVRRAPARRSWAKTALIIGGSAASGAGLGAVIGGSKGAAAGAAIGGGAASIYEASKRR